MEQRTKARWAGTRGRIGICLFCMALFFTGHTAMTQAAPAPNELQSQFTSAQDGGTIQLGAGQTIRFGNNQNAVLVDAKNLTLKGWTSGGFTETIGTLAGSVTAQKDSLTPDAFRNMVGNWKAGLLPYSALSGIEGYNPGGINERELPSGNNDVNKWLSTPAGDSSGANGLSLRDIRFGNVNVEYLSGRYVNGLIGNDNLASGDTSIGDITGNVFTSIGVTLQSTSATNYLAGGGLVGVRSTGEVAGSSGNAEMGLVSGNIFDGIRITTTNDGANHLDFAPNPNAPIDPSAYIEGGGLIGVNGASSPGNVEGHAFLRQLSDNYFTTIDILSNDILLGGGLIGVNNNSKHATDPAVYAMLGNPNDPGNYAGAASGGVLRNVFGNGEDGNIRVRTGYSIRGGGVIGMNGLSNAAVDLVNLENNAFAGISVETGTYIKGGGIVGLQTNDGGISGSTGNDGHDLGADPMSAATATLRNASGNLFLNQTVKTGSYIQGGGVIGLRSNLGVAELRTLQSNVFKGITVDTGAAQAISGGGVVGLSAALQATMGATGGVQNNYFDDITVRVGGDNLNGGGILGAHARNDAPGGGSHWATIEEVNGNIFTDARVASMNIHGGGIVGVNGGGGNSANPSVQQGLSALGNIRNNIFHNLDIVTINSGAAGDGHLQGGGVIGVWNYESDEALTWSAIDAVEDNSFTDIRVTSGTYLQGGGIIGVRGSGGERIERIARNVFMDNAVTVAEDIDGGGVIGVTSPDGNNPLAGIGRIDESLFARNTVSAGENVMGGIVYSYGLDGGMTIRNSRFIDNTISSANGIVYGAVTVDTGSDSATAEHTLTLTADSGNSTVFQNNRITDKVAVPSRLDTSRRNSLYFGTIPTRAGVEDPAANDAKLIVDPQAGGVVALYDPIWVNQADGPSANDPTNYTFTMNARGAGDFIWGGKNVFTLDPDVAGAVTLEPGSTTTLLDGGSATTFVNGEKIAGDHVQTMMLDAPNFTFNLAEGATLNVEGHNRFDLHGEFGAGPDPRTPAAALNGNLHFNLNNTHVYSQGDVPGDANHLLPDNNVRLTAGHTPLLTINVPDSTGMVDVGGSTVSLGNFAAGPKLKDGDRFYLVELDHAAFTSGNPSNDTAYARQGMLTRYAFTIDKNMDNLGREEDTRFLVARLKSVGPAPEFDSPNTGRITGVSVLQRVSDRLPELEFFGPDFPAEEPWILRDPCDTCIDSRPRTARRDPSEWRWTGFADVRGSWYRADAGAGYADIRAAHYLGGIAGGRQLQDGRILAGVFADAGNADYDTRNRVQLPEGATTLHGQGDIQTTGVGAFLRRNWNNGFGVDLMARGGRLENEFYSGDIVTNGIPAHYELNTTYLGAGVGLNYERQYEKNTFDVYGRYSWHRENGGEVWLSTNETVEFEPLDSHRLIGGTRLTRQTDADFAWYIGAAYEHELAGSSRAVERSNGGNMSFEGVNLRGGTGIGEIGVILHSKENVSLTLGLEAYAGQREGGSAIASVAWRF